MNIFSEIETFHFGETMYQGGGHFGPISQPQLEFVIIHAGTAEVIADDQRHRLIEGYAALVMSRRHLLYTYLDGADILVAWCEASLPAAHGRLADYLADQPFMLPVTRRMLDLQRMGMDLGYGGDVEADMLGAALGRALYQEFLFQAHVREREHPIHRSVLRARQFIEQKLSEPCALSDVAAYANVTPQYLTRLFRRDLAQTPIQYLWTLRAKKAVQLLRRTGLSVAEIAYRCGYENANHFSRHIKEHFGAPPTELRRRRWDSLD